MTDCDYEVYTDPYLGYSLGLALAGFSGGRAKMAYYLDDPNGKRIFEGADFGPAPSMSCDGPEAATSLLSFLTLQEGDTDPDYFEGYTQDQLDWTEGADCEELRSFVYDLEEGDSERGWLRTCYDCGGSGVFCGETCDLCNGMGKVEV